MLRKILILFALIVAMFSVNAISPYLYFGQLNNKTSETINLINKALVQNGFEVLGQYNPEANKNIHVIVFTNDDIKRITFNKADRGALASALKIAVIAKGGKPNIYLLNPEYIYWAYLGKTMDQSAIRTPLKQATDKITTALEFIGTTPSGIGGKIDTDDLEKYRYMFGMERFTDPVELNTFSSFSEGIKTITTNLNAQKGNTKLVYSIIDKSKQTAVFGIGLLNKEEGEPFFLPIIGEDHAAALPYEIILQGKEATMLHGRYRIALHWPELSMSTFTKIINTPGDIEDTMEGLTK